MLNWFKQLLMSDTKPGHIYFISGPSGVGKGTVIDMLRERHSELVFPPSCTTRNPRPGEKEGKTYFFVSKVEFQAKIKAGDFLEYAIVHGGNYYGTLKRKLLDPAEAGQIVVREFDVQGFSQAREVLDRALYTSIFIRPEDDNLDQLVARIQARSAISEADIAHRVESMKRELALAHIYDHQIVSRHHQINELYEAVEAVVIG